MPPVPQASDPCKDRHVRNPTKRGGTRSYRPGETYSAVIPGRREATSPESISHQGLRPDGFSDVQLHIVVRCFRIAPE
jgi:hypothetical protein